MKGRQKILDTSGNPMMQIQRRPYLDSVVRPHRPGKWLVADFAVEIDNHRRPYPTDPSRHPTPPSYSSSDSCVFPTLSGHSPPPMCFIPAAITAIKQVRNGRVPTREGHVLSTVLPTGVVMLMVMICYVWIHDLSLRELGPGLTDCKECLRILSVTKN